MEYANFSYDQSNPKSYIYQPEVLDYIHKYAEHFNLLQYIKVLQTLKINGHFKFLVYLNTF